MRAEEFVLREAYADRLEQVANAVRSRFGSDPVTRDRLTSAIIGMAGGIPLGSVSPAEFAKDVIKHLGNTVNIERAKASPSARQQAQAKFKNELLPRLTLAVETELGNIFPDGDPSFVDQVILTRWRNVLKPVQRALGNWDTYEEWFRASVWPRVQAEFKKVHKGDMWDYLADIWDEQRDQAVSDYEHGTGSLDPQWKRGNPYRSYR